MKKFMLMLFIFLILITHTYADFEGFAFLKIITPDNRQVVEFTFDSFSPGKATLIYRFVKEDVRLELYAYHESDTVALRLWIGDFLYTGEVDGTTEGITVFTSNNGSCYFFTDRILLRTYDLPDKDIIEIDAGSYIIMFE